MPESVFRGLFDSQTAAVIPVSDFLLCMGVSLILGLILAFTYMYRTRSSKSFVVSLALLPAVVCVGPRSEDRGVRGGGKQEKVRFEAPVARCGPAAGVRVLHKKIFSNLKFMV